jgi:hypothetical protein
VCLTVLMGDLGAAHAGLDVQRLVMVLSPRLSIAERVIAARRLLARAGQQQTTSVSGEATCLCGVALNLALPIAEFPGRQGDLARSIPVTAGNAERAFTAGMAAARTIPASRRFTVTWSARERRAWLRKIPDEPPLLTGQPS